MADVFISSGGKSRAAYFKLYRQAHPAEMLKYRLNAAATLLVQHGYTITAPTGQTISNKDEKEQD